MNAVADVSHALLDLKQRVDGVATALIGRDGAVLSACLPEDAYAETFAILCATAFGAASAASIELGRACPERIVIDGPDSRTIIVASGPHALVAAVVHTSQEPSSVNHEVAKFASLLGAR